MSQNLDKLLAQLVNLHPKYIDLSLDRLLKLLNKLGNPHLKIPPVIHIAGTNGKGSTLSYLRQIMMEKKYSEQQWQEKLTPEQFDVCRKKGTERPFTGEYNDCKKHGTYFCACCGNQLFESDTKFNSGTGWPSFWEAIDNKNINEIIIDHHLRFSLSRIGHKATIRKTRKKSSKNKCVYRANNPPSNCFCDMSFP